jgi:hypothetical protein
MRLPRNPWSNVTKDMTQVINLLVVNGVLLFILLVTNLGWGPEQVRIQSSFEIPILDVVEFQIIEPGLTPSIFNQDAQGGWTFSPNGIQEYPARNSRIEDFLRSIDRLEVLRLVSKSGDLDEFGFQSQASRRFIGITSDNQEIELEFGFPSSRGDELYMRLGSSRIVYGVSGTLGFFLSQGPLYWTELRLWPQGLELEDVLSFRLNYQFFNPQIFLQDTLANGTLTWVQTQGDPLADTEAGIARRARELLSLLISWEFVQILPNDQSNLELRPELQVGEFQIQAHGSRFWNLEVYDVGEVNYLLRIVDQDSKAKIGEFARWRLDPF